MFSEVYSQDKRKVLFLNGHSTYCSTLQYMKLTYTPWEEGFLVFRHLYSVWTQENVLFLSRNPARYHMALVLMCCPTHLRNLSFSDFSSLWWPGHCRTVMVRYYNGKLSYHYDLHGAFPLIRLGQSYGNS
jgi:hypothetical protein